MNFTSLTNDELISHADFVTDEFTLEVVKRLQDAQDNIRWLEQDLEAADMEIHDLEVRRPSLSIVSSKA